MKVNKKSEYVSKDILEENFIKTFRIVYYIQTLMGSTRVHIKDRFVTSPTVFQKCHTILNIFLIVILNVFIIQKYIFSVSSNNTGYYIGLCATELQSITFVCNVIHVRFFNGEANAEFYIKLQKIDRCMRLDHNKINVIVYRVNILTVAGVCVIFCCLLAVAATKGPLTLLSFAGITYTQSCFALEIACCSNFWIHFFIRIRFINSIIRNHIKQNKFLHISPGIPLLATKIFMRRLAGETHNFTCSETDVYLKEIFDGFSKLQNIFRFQVFIFCCKLVFTCLITFEFLLYGVQNDNIEMLESLMPAVFTLIDLFIAIILGVRAELFFREVRETKLLAITIMSMHYEGKLREKAKKMLKLIDETPPRFSVYDMWMLDANVLLKMFALVTSLILTQLQFAVL